MRIKIPIHLSTARPVRRPSDRMKRLLPLLAQAGLPLPASTHSGNFERRLHVAAAAKIGCHQQAGAKKKAPPKQGEDALLSLSDEQFLQHLRQHAQYLRGEADRHRGQASGRPFHLSLSSRGGGHWITIGGHKDQDGTRHGGSPVYIEDGRITRGHPGLTGKKIDALREPGEDVSHRKAMSQGREYHRARYAKQAKAEGIDPQHLHQLAGEMLAHDKEYTEDRTRMLQRARSLSKGLNYGDISNLKARNAGGRIDAASLKGLDDVAERVGEEFPHLFHGRGGEKVDQLFDMLAAGNPEPMTEDAAYQQAHEHLAEEGRRQREEADRYRMQPGEEVPF